MAFPYSSGDVLTAADLNQSSGLVFVKSQTIGTGVSSVTVTGAFSSTFENYRVLITDYTGSSVPQWIEFQWEGITASYYGATHKVDRFGTASNVGRNNQSSLLIGETVSAAGPAGISLEVYSPANGGNAGISSNAVGSLSLITAAGSRSFSTTATGFLIKPSGGTLTGGIIRVYGYNNG